MVPEVGVEPTRGVTSHDFESCASANSATPAIVVELTGIEPVMRQCHCRVIPLHYSPTTRDDFNILGNVCQI